MFKSAVVNASPLIYLGRTGNLRLIEGCARDVHVTTEGLTLGTAKDIVNKAIARRIQKAAVVLASQESPPQSLPIAGDYIYGSIDDAARDLPPSMFSSRPGEVGDNAIDWTSFDPKEPIDWASVVALQ